MIMVPRVVDISHYTKVTDMQKTADAGIWGIICKASQGTRREDESYAPNRKKCAATGMEWGAYHFPTGDDVAAQVTWFLHCAQADDKTLMCLDYESNPNGSSMSIHQMVEFLSLAEKKLGRKLVIYSGNFLKEQIDELSAADQLYVADHKLWLAHYSSNPTVPHQFHDWWLHQYTGDGAGPGPHSVPGLGGESGGLDLNQYKGTRPQLKAEWAAPLVTTQAPPVVVAPVVTPQPKKSWWPWG